MLDGCRGICGRQTRNDRRRRHSVAIEQYQLCHGIRSFVAGRCAIDRHVVSRTDQESRGIEQPLAHRARAQAGTCRRTCVRRVSSAIIVRPLLCRRDVPRPHGDNVLLARNGALDTPVFLSSESDIAGQLTAIDLGKCPRTTCAVTGVAWLRPGRTFVVSRVEDGSSLGSAPPAGGVLYAYDLGSRRATQVLRLPNEAIGRVSASADGRTVV